MAFLDYLTGEEASAVFESVGFSAGLGFPHPRGF